MHLQLHIFRLQYSFQRICPAIVHITTIQCALYWKLVNKYSAHPPIYAMWTVVPDIYNVLQHRIFRLLYSCERICAAIGGISTIQCALYCILGAKYSAHPPVYAMCTVVPGIYNALTAPYIQTSTFIWTYLRCNWRYSDTSMRVTLQIWCLIQRTSFSLRCVNCIPGHIQRIYSSSYSGHNIQLNVTALQLEIFRHFDPRYTANWESNTAHILRFTLCELWSRSYAM
jgi:hypothetical protein